MAKLFPYKQQLISSDLADGQTIAISRVKSISATSDHVELPGVAQDVAFLHAAKATADPSFYLTDGDTQLNIDGATAGTDFVIVSRHAGNTNYMTGPNFDPNRPL